MTGIKMVSELYSREKVRELEKIIKRCRFVIGPDWYKAEREKPEQVQRLKNTMNELKKLTEIRCMECGKVSGSLWASKDLSRVYCRECADRKELLIQVDRYIGDCDRPTPTSFSMGGGSYKFGQVVMHVNEAYYGINGQRVSCGYMTYVCWVNDGMQMWPLSEEELNRLRCGEIGQVMANINMLSNAGIVRCTRCNKQMRKEEVAGYPLFAGVNCSECWEKHCEETEQQRRDGKVCGLCGKPWNDCYC